MDDPIGSLIDLHPISWRQTVLSPQPRAENKRCIDFVAKAIYPKIPLLTNGLMLSELRVKMSVLKTPVLYGNGKPVDISISCGVLSFSEAFHDSETGSHSEPSLHGWFCLEPAEFDDLWERVKDGVLGKPLISLRVSGIKLGWTPDNSDDRWEIESTPSLTILAAEVIFTYGSG